MSASHSTVDLPSDRAYQTHHFNCPACCAAGKTPGLQKRCTQGQHLWNAYLKAALPLTKHANSGLLFWIIYDHRE